MSVHPVNLSRADQDALAVLAASHPELSAMANTRVSSLRLRPRRPTPLSQMSAEDWAAYDERDMDLSVGQDDALYEDDCA